MDISAQWIWLVTGLILAGAEIFVGTFWLLVLGVGCLLAAALAWIGMPAAWQFSIFAAAVIVGGLLVHKLAGKARSEESDVLQHPDVGQSVTVAAWNEDRTAQVTYRGTQWTATAVAGSALQPGRWTIAQVQGARLVLKPQAES